MAIELTDIQGQVHTIDFENLQSDYINIDCMDALKKMPDKCIDLAVVDPPYGDVGGVWDNKERGRFGGLFDKYHITETDIVSQVRKCKRQVREVQTTGEFP